MPRGTTPPCYRRRRLFALALILPPIFLLTLAPTLPMLPTLETRFYRNRPTPDALAAHLRKAYAPHAGFNHPYVGWTRPPRGGEGLLLRDVPLPPEGGWKRVTKRRKLGQGKAAYLAARDFLMDWKMHHDSEFSEIFLDPPIKRVRGTSPWVRNLLTVAKTRAPNLWVANPCRMVYHILDEDLTGSAAVDAYLFDDGDDSDFLDIHVEEDEGPANCGSGEVGEPVLGQRSQPLLKAQVSSHVPTAGIQSAVSYATLDGHLFQGEERMRVIWLPPPPYDPHGEGDVVFEIVSISKGKGVVGRAALRLAADTQDKFFQEQVDTMAALVSKVIAEIPVDVDDEEVQERIQREYREVDGIGKELEAGGAAGDDGSSMAEGPSSRLSFKEQMLLGSVREDTITTPPRRIKSVTASSRSSPTPTYNSAKALEEQTSREANPRPDKSMVEAVSWLEFQEQMLTQSAGAAGKEDQTKGLDEDHKPRPSPHAVPLATTQQLRSVAAHNERCKWETHWNTVTRKNIDERREGIAKPFART